MGIDVPGATIAPATKSKSAFPKVAAGTALLAGAIGAAGIQDADVNKVDVAKDNQARSAHVVSNNYTNQNPRALAGLLGLNMYQGLQEASKILPQKNYSTELRQIQGFGQRQDYINNLLREANPQLLPSVPNSQPTALAEFNRRHNMNLVCLGVKELTERRSYYETVTVGHELVFVDMDYLSGRNNIPVRIGINYTEAAATQGKDNVLSLLESKLNAHNQTMQAQHTVWNAPYEFGFTPNQGACMFVLEQAPLRGMGTDLISSLRAYTGRYGMTVNAINVGDFHEDTLQNLLENENIQGLPEFGNATKEAILQDLESALQRAVDDGKNYFVFHYYLHGDEHGGIHTSDDYTHAVINPSEFAEVISRPYGKSNRPLCEQIDIFMWAASCYSGKQIDGIRSYFENHREIPVRNLRVVAESDDTSSWTNTPGAMSLATSLPIMNDNSGITDFYSAVFDEYQNQLVNRGVRIEDRARSQLWKIRFVDVMSRFDSPESQDLQGFHFSNNPNYNKIFEHQFSQLEPRISENLEEPSMYAQLDGRMDLTSGERPRKLPPIASQIV